MLSRVFLSALLLLVHCHVIANDAVREIVGTVKSSRPIKQIRPVRIREDYDEFQANDPQRAYQMEGKDALLKVSPDRVDWSWVLSFSGGNGRIPADVIVQCDDGAAFEGVELTFPGKPLAPGAAPRLSTTVADERQKELAASRDAALVMVLNRFNNAKKLKQRLIVYGECQQMRAYLSLVRFGSDKKHSMWALVRTLWCEGHSRTDVLRLSTDNEIRGYRSYRVIAKFDASGDNTLDLDDPAACLIDERRDDRH